MQGPSNITTTSTPTPDVGGPGGGQAEQGGPRATPEQPTFNVPEPGPGGPQARQRTQQRNQLAIQTRVELEELGVPQNQWGRIVREVQTLYDALQQLTNSLRPYT